jgi:feruloyl-CoA synthase
MSKVKYRPLAFGVTEGHLVPSHDFAQSGVQYFRAKQALEPHAERITDRFLHWVNEAPQATIFAQRELLENRQRGQWQEIRYGQALGYARSIGQALIDRGLNVDRPVVILSDNDLEHAMLALACIYVGVPHCSVSPAYSLISNDFGKLKHIVDLLSPGLVFVASKSQFSKALSAAVASHIEVVDADTLRKGDASDQCRHNREVFVYLGVNKNAQRRY